MRGRPDRSKTPLPAAFFCAALCLAGCQSAQRPPELPAGACTEDVTPVAAVQGDSELSPMLGRAVRVRGVVTLVLDDGAYLQEPGSDMSKETSDGLYVRDPGLAGIVHAGDQVVAAGSVAELGAVATPLTALTELTGYRVCASEIPLPISDARLPLSGAEKEALEGMNVLMQQSLAVTDVFGLRDGRLRLSMNRILPAPTEVARPGADARAQAQRNRRNSIPAMLHRGDTEAYSVGTGIMAARGVLGHDGEGLRLLLTEPLASMPRTVYRNDPPAKGDVRVVGLNLHNYFNGDGAGGGFPATRGARSPEDFAAQRAGLAALVEYAAPHLVAVQELENDGFGSRSAARDFIRDLQGAGGSWAVVNPNDAPIGSDQITVGIFYRTDILRPTGQAKLLTRPPFNDLSRVPVAQWFVHAPSRQSFLVVVNHFKSKGSCPGEGPNRNLRDGQGCWNRARVQSARRLAAWVNDMLNVGPGRQALILGDMNAYRLEDPIAAIIEAGFKDLTASTGLQHEYTFVFRGEAGTLDYAFASPALVPHVRSARILNINAGYPRGVPLEYPFLGASDHDPVVVDLRFRQSATSD